MNIRCTWHRVTDSYHQLRTPRGIVLAHVVSLDGKAWAEVAMRNGGRDLWDYGGDAADLDAAKAVAEQMAAGSET